MYKVNPRTARAIQKKPVLKNKIKDMKHFKDMFTYVWLLTPYCFVAPSLPFPLPLEPEDGHAPQARQARPATEPHIQPAEPS